MHTHTEIPTYSKCCFISLSSAYCEMPLTNKVRFTFMEEEKTEAITNSMQMLDAM